MFRSCKKLMIRYPNVEKTVGSQISRKSRMLVRCGTLAVLAMMLIVPLTSCTKETSTESAELIATQFYDAIQKKDYDKAMGFYADEFFTLKPADAWLDYLKQVNNTLGDLKKVKLKHKDTSTVFSGRRFVFVFTNEYEKGLAKETVIFFKHTSKPGVKIQAHTFDSSKLQSNGVRR